MMRDAVMGRDARFGGAVAVHRYWPAALTVIYVMMGTVAVRLHEFVPGASLIKPVLLVSIVGAAMLASQSGPGAMQAGLRHPMTRLALAYFAWVALTVPFAMWPGLAFLTWRGLLPGILMFAAFFFCPPTRDSLQRVQTMFVLLVLIYAVYAQTVGQMFGGRLYAGGMYDSNDMASLMAITFPLAAGVLTRSAKGRARIVAAVAVVGLVLAITATSSRGGILAMVAGALVFSFGFRGGRSLLVIAALVAGGFVGWNTASPEFRDRMRTLTNLEQDYNTTDDTGRKAVWRRGRGYIMQHPVIGVGAGNFPIAEGGALTDEGRRGKWSAAHNAYIQAYAELGVVGGTLFVALLVAAARRARVLWRVAPTPGRSPPLHRPELLAALAAFCAGGYFLSHAYFLPGLTLLGLIALADRVRTAEAAGVVPAGSSPDPNPARLRGQRGGLALGVQRARRLNGIG